MNSLSLLKKQVDERCQKVENCPEGRLSLRKAFYEKYGFSKLAKYGYGQSEINFIEWEIKRGVLNTIDDANRQGSIWWRNMNMQLIYDSEFARVLTESKAYRSPCCNSVKKWLNYIQHPSPQTWYQAHNGSVIAACIKFSKEVAIESVYEKKFIKDVLIRVLFAQAMVEGKEFAFGKMGKLLANPIFPAVKIITGRPKLYPKNYPLEQETQAKANGFFIESYLKNMVHKYVLDKNEKELFQFASEAIGHEEIEKIYQLINHIN
ncbi:hypothetical protein [Aquimarina spongiae]|uniref:Uncharacterized protein n=1 Tax=Aquimarina spongiae TaxID=570521 RepID=A0A1M6B340_9FLAO|nr:hypothetical protein [Aquimarina spongiae]SHI43151.1 hypothetical protein SAMN04488508_101604 [Aquimarina spongiae]